MSLREYNVVHESKTCKYWVHVNGWGDYIVYKSKGTHSVRCATFGGGLPDARSRAIAECERRELAQDPRPLG